MKKTTLAPLAVSRGNWLFEVEPYSRTHKETLSDLRENARLKKFLKRAVNSDIAPLSLIESVKAGIRA